MVDFRKHSLMGHKWPHWRQSNRSSKWAVCDCHFVSGLGRHTDNLGTGRNHKRAYIIMAVAQTLSCYDKPGWNTVASSIIITAPNTACTRLALRARWTGRTHRIGSGQRPGHPRPARADRFVNTQSARQACEDNGAEDRRSARGSSEAKRMIPAADMLS